MGNCCQPEETGTEDGPATNNGPPKVQANKLELGHFDRKKDKTPSGSNPKNRTEITKNGDSSGGHSNHIKIDMNDEPQGLELNEDPNAKPYIPRVKNQSKKRVAPAPPLKYDFSDPKGLELEDGLDDTRRKIKYQSHSPIVINNISKLSRTRMKELYILFTRWCGQSDNNNNDYNDSNDNGGKEAKCLLSEAQLADGLGGLSIPESEASSLAKEIVTRHVLYPQSEGLSFREFNDFVLEATNSYAET